MEVEASLIHSANMRNIPPNFILPVDERPLLSNVPSFTSIPIIDLKRDGEEEEDLNSLLVQKVSQACEEYGFFQIINHGIPEELCNKMLAAVAEFFQLAPEERCQFFLNDPTKQVGIAEYYLHVDGQAKVKMWSESFGHPWHPTTVDHVTRLLPTTPPQYREVFGEYEKEIGGLMYRLLRLISQGLGLEKDYLRRSLGKEPRLRAQANYYTPCPDPELTLGLAAHTDFSALTILRQSEGVTGLQVIKDDIWVSVDPVPNSFIINLGDQIQVMSNGRYKSVHHRAVTNKNLPRVSMAMFYTPNKDTIIGPIEDLIDEKHPPLYRNYRFAEFLEEFQRQEGTRRRVKEVFELQPLP